MTTPEVFVEACRAILNKDNDPNTLNQANELLFQITNDPESVPLLLQVLQSDAPEGQHFALIILKNRVANQMAPDLSQQLREILLTGLYSGKLNSILLNDVVDVISLIACFEWPEQWPEFGQHIQPSDQPIGPTIHLLSTFLEVMNESTAITSNRRQILCNYVSDLSSTIFPIIVQSLQDESIAPIGLKSLNYLLATIPSSLVSRDLINALLFTYLDHSATHCEAIKCLQTYFCDRHDSLTSIFHLGAMIVTAFSPQHTIAETGAPVSSSEEALKFLIMLMTQYYVHFINILTPETAMMQVEMGQCIRLGQVSPDAYQKDLINIFNVILSNQNKEIPSWDLWLDMLRRYFLDNSSDGPSAIITFFKPLLPYIVQSLYSFLGDAAVDAEGSLMFSARNCWSLLARIDLDNILTFLREQTITPSLGYALGCFQFLTRKSPANDAVAAIIRDAASHPSIHEPKIGAAFMFAMAKMINPAMFRHFIDMVIAAIQSEDAFLMTAATHNLLAVVKDAEINDMFLEDDMGIVEEMIELCETVVANHPKPEKFYKCVALMIQNQLSKEGTHDRARALFEMLMAPLQAELVPNEEVCKVLTIIDSVSAVLKPWVCEMFGENINKIVQEWVPSTEIPYEVLDPLMNLAATVCTPESLPLVVNAMAAHGKPEDVFYKYFTTVRRNEPSAETLFPQIKGFLLDTITDPSETPMFAVIEMLSAFDVNNFDVPWTIEYMIEALKDLHDDINIAAVKFLVDFIAKRPETEQIIASFGLPLLQQALTSITDMMHKGALDALVELVANLLISSDDKGSAVSQLIALLQELIGPEPAPNFYEAFGTRVIDMLTTYHLGGMVEIFHDMLILARRMTQSDASRLFSRKKAFNPMNHHHGGFAMDLFNIDQDVAMQMAIEESLMPTANQLVEKPSIATDAPPTHF